MIHLVTVPRFRSRMSALHPVNRIKHVVDGQFAVAAGVIQNVTLIDASDTPVIAQTDEVITGSKVNGIYLKVEVVATSSAALPNVYMLVAKNPGNQITVPNPNAVGSSVNKKVVIHQEMIMMQKQDGSNPRTLFNGVIKIPRHMQRFAPNDNLLLRVLAPGVTIEFCIQCHYKEFR